MALHQGQVSVKRLMAICVEKDNLEVSLKHFDELRKPNVSLVVSCKSSNCCHQAQSDDDILQHLPKGPAPATGCREILLPLLA